MNSTSKKIKKGLFPEYYGEPDKCMLAYMKKIQEYADNVKNATVLDVGCGLGSYSELFTKNHNKVTALDIQDLRDPLYSKNFRFVLYDGDIFPFKDKTFDVITNFDVIEHIKKDKPFVKEMFRVLKPGGRVIIATPNRHRVASLLLQLIGKKDVFPKVMQWEGVGGKSVHEREYTANELKDLFSYAGFKDIHVLGCWMGIRGTYNFGTEHFIIPAIAQTLFLEAVK